jgi:hypothetical protein
MITVNGAQRIHLARSLADAVLVDPLTRLHYGRPPLREMLLLPTAPNHPVRKYLDSHREKIFAR